MRVKCYFQVPDSKVYNVPFNENRFSIRNSSFRIRRSFMELIIEVNGHIVEGESVDVTFKGWDKISDDDTVRAFHMMEVQLRSFQNQIVKRMRLKEEKGV